MTEDSQQIDREPLRIERIKKGTVIDHIKAGTALTVLNILGLDGSDGKLITVGINVQSKKSGGKKDIIKVEDVFLDNQQLNQISLITANATITYIEDYKVKDKKILSLPKRFIGIFSCPNENCASNMEREPVKSEYEVLTENPLKIRCVFCSRVMLKDEIPALLRKK